MKGIFLDSKSLDMEDIDAIDRYIINRFKKAIRNGKARLMELGVE